MTTSEPKRRQTLPRLQADDAGADDAEALRHGLKLQGAGGVHDAVWGQRRRRNLHGHGAGGQNHGAGLQFLDRSVMALQGYPPTRQQLAGSGQAGDAVALEQGGNAVGEPLHHLLLARHHLGDVHRQPAYFQADLAKMIPGLNKLV